MNHEELHEVFEKFNEEFLEFENIPKSKRLHHRRDLCAMIYLHNKLGGDGAVIESAEHDQIWFSFDNLEELSEGDVLYVVRCGIMFDDSVGMLSRFV